jgi:hypothetical protein
MVVFLKWRVSFWNTHIRCSVQVTSSFPPFGTFFFLVFCSPCVLSQDVLFYFRLLAHETYGFSIERVGAQACVTRCWTELFITPYSHCMIVTLDVTNRKSRFVFGAVLQTVPVVSLQLVCTVSEISISRRINTLLALLPRWTCPTVLNRAERYSDEESLKYYVCNVMLHHRNQRPSPFYLYSGGTRFEFHQLLSCFVFHGSLKVELRCTCQHSFGCRYCSLVTPSWLPMLFTSSACAAVLVKLNGELND